MGSAIVFSVLKNICESELIMYLDENPKAVASGSGLEGVREKAQVSQVDPSLRLTVQCICTYSQ
jgi:hypothetical protein